MRASVVPKIGLVAALMFSGCSGAIQSEAADDSPSSPGTSAPGGKPGSIGSLPDKPPPEDADRAAFRRLTRLEYDQTVRDLLDDTSKPGTRFLTSADTQGSAGFYTSASPSVAVVRSLFDAAEAVAAAAVPRFGKILGCMAGAGEDTCAKSFIAKFGARAYRRPLTTAERSELEGFYTSARKEPGATFNDTMRLLIARVLMAPQFLYRWELGPQAAAAQGGLVKLDGYEMASRLSYFLWGTMPDDALFAAAQAGTLDDPEGVVEEAKRLLADPRAAAALESFHHQWLDLGRLTAATKEDAAWNPALQESLYASVQAFARHVYMDGDGRLKTLLLSPVAFVDASVAALYGVPAPSGQGLARVELDPGERAGVLTQTGVLAGLGNAYEGSAILRGKLVRERFLCEPLPLPPPELDTTLAPAKPGASERDRLEDHAKNDVCAGCHKFIDPIGFGFDRYDSLGRFRLQDRTGPVNAKGHIEPLSGVGAPVTFEGAVELAQKLAASGQVAECLARQWYRFALGRLENERDTGSLARVAAKLHASGDLRQLLLAIVGTKAFSHRTPFAEEVLQ